MKFGIIGFGSIGRRHAENLQALGFCDTVLLREKGVGNNLGLDEVSNLTALLNSGIDQVILANPTSMHLSYLQDLMMRGVNIIAEKPLLARPEEVGKLEMLLRAFQGTGMVAYNMRFHPCVKEAERFLNRGALGKIYSANLFVGQYLPDWRPDRDYRETYSAQRALGGGVGLDLIHDIDLAIHLFGEPKDHFYAIADQVSDLEIDTEDLVEILYRTADKSTISIHLDYLTRGYRRDIYVIGENGNIVVDLSKSTMVWTDQSGETQDWSFPKFRRNDMYMDLLKSFISHVREGTQPSPSFKDGLLSNEIAFKAREDYYND